ncbi:MAG TPA: lipid-binding SYLF domain-containing protein [Geobacteraceae bacterium]|nr:lipid-binding SYLF domain-containing protein [Geobacteraceae bacterium]
MGTKAKNTLLMGLAILSVILAFGLVSGSYMGAMAADKLEAQSIVDKAQGTFGDMMSDSNFSWMEKYIKQARGIIIFPEVLKGGFFIGGSAATGVLLVRDNETGAWSGPAFYTLASVTLGLQIGGEAAEVVMLAMTRKAVDHLLSSSVKLSGDASIAAGPFGGGAKESVSVPEVTADYISFTKSKGLYAGLNLEGSVLAVRDSLDETYYGQAVSPKDIFFHKKAVNPGADWLRSDLDSATRSEIKVGVK